MKLVDTDILIDFSCGHAKATQFLINLEKEGSLNISQVSEMEYLVGCRNLRELRLAKEFLSRCRIVPIREASSRLAADFLSSFYLRHKIGILDCLIAATAICEGFSLVSRNRKHYRIISELVLEVPY